MGKKHGNHNKAAKLGSQVGTRFQEADPYGNRAERREAKKRGIKKPIESFMYDAPIGTALDDAEKGEIVDVALNEHGEQLLREMGHDL